MEFSLPVGWEGTRATLDQFDMQVSSGNPVVDLSHLKFVTAYGLVGLACIIAQNATAGIATTVLLPNSTDVNNYLSRMGFQNILDTYNCSISKKLSTVHSANMANYLLELQIFEDSSSVERLSALVYHRLDGHISPQRLNAIYMGLGEIADNVRYHSGLSWGIVAAQTYQTDTPWERIEFAIGDIGIGLRKALTRHEPRSDEDAIRLAIQYNISGTEDVGRGVGLPTTIEEVTSLKGYTHLKSGMASVNVFSETEIKVWQTIHLNGTVIGVEVPCHHAG